MSPLWGEVCEVDGNCLFYDLSKLYYRKDIGLYREDGVAAFKKQKWARIW